VAGSYKSDFVTKSAGFIST